MTTRTLLIHALLWTGGVYCVNFIFLGFLIGPFDFDHLSTYYELAWRFWRTQIGLPHYNPYFCGGRTLGADPQIPIFNPLVFLVPLISSIQLVKIEMLTQLAVGAYCLVKILEYFKASTEGILWGLLLFLAGGATVARFMVGHVTLGFIFLFPVFLYLSYRLSETGRRWGYWLAYWGLFIYCGLYKPNFLIYAVPLLLIETATRSILLRSVMPLVVLFSGITWCLVVNAITFLPAGYYFSLFPRSAQEIPTTLPLTAFLANMLLPLKAVPEALYGSPFYQRHEYNLFIGPIAVYFVTRAWPEIKKSAEMKSLLVLLIFSMFLGMGSASPEKLSYLPYTWFWRFWPGFTSVRVPPRFWFGAFIALVVFSACGYRKIRPLGFLIVGVLPLVFASTINLTKTSLLAHTSSWWSPESFPSEIHWTHADVDEPYLPIRLGLGVLECVDNIPTFQAPDLEMGDSLQIKSSGTVRVSAAWKNWKTIQLEAVGQPPYSFSLNINHSRFWKFSDPKVSITSQLGSRLTLTSLNTDRLQGELVFTQPYVREAFVISLISTLTFLIVCCTYIIRRRRPLLL